MTRLKDERGFALASVVFLGAVMILLTAVMVVRAVSQGSVEVETAEWEQAVHVAEGELEAYLATLAASSDPDALNTGHTIAALGTRSAVIAAADALAAVDPSSVVDAPEGQAVIIHPIDDRLVFSVGFTPSIADPGRKARVVVSEYEVQPSTIPNWSADKAVFTGGDFDMTGSADVTHLDPTQPGDVHANGSLTLNVASRISGCGTEATDSGYFQAGCPAAQVPAEPVPVVDATKVHDLSWYDLCSDGAHYGPAHPTSPGGVAGTPCSGPLTAMPAGWSGGGTSWTVNGMATGVFYVVGGDVFGSPGIATGPPSGRGPAIMTLVVDRVYGPSETVGACGQGTGGSVDFGSKPFLMAHPSTVNPGEVGIGIVAEGEIDAGSSATLTGLILTGETLTTSGGTDIVGPVAAVDACATGTAFGGGLDLVYPGAVSTPFDAVDPNASGFTAGDRNEL